ncbi:hypothetical protein BYT27DRAFT_7246269 [Phlegmacium glaucopus]|nr:hypothetical protein BYT27DRAFT_7246269 [Phlegmacium glaucopus]
MLETAHWVNTVRSKAKLEEKAKVEQLLKNLGIVHILFKLDDTSNLTNFDRNMHFALDNYAFYAVTGTVISLNYLINLVRGENNKWDSYANKRLPYSRLFPVEDAPICNLGYELVVLHPEHLLPNSNDLSVFHRDSNGNLDKKSYVVGDDRILREFPGVQSSPRFPSFSPPHRATPLLPLNPFLVIINAEIKFRRYLRQAQSKSLPDDVMELINKTVELVDLIFWKPEVLLKEEGCLSSSALMDVDDDFGSASECNDWQGEVGGGNTVKQHNAQRAYLPRTEEDEEFLEMLNNEDNLLNDFSGCDLSKMANVKEWLAA